MTQSAAEIANEFDLTGHTPLTGGTFNEIHQRLTFYEQTHYSQYVPTLGSEYPTYQERLSNWLANTSDEAIRRILLELAPKIAFITREDIAQLHQSAFIGPISHWLIDQLGIPFADPALSNRIYDELENYTWFTSITDSMHISEFHHAHRIGGIEFRPDWKSLAQFGDPKNIQDFIDHRQAMGVTKPIRRIVILEDFVGSGAQMKMGEGSVDFAASSFPNTPILLVPLIVCPQGARLSRALAGQYPNLTFSPVLEVEEHQLINSQSNYPAGSFEHVVKDICDTLYSYVKGNDAAKPRPYKPHGFADTGAMIVLYSNTPANTLPIIQHESNTWSALFPRSARMR